MRFSVSTIIYLCVFVCLFWFLVLLHLMWETSILKLFTVFTSCKVRSLICTDTQGAPSHTTPSPHPRLQFFPTAGCSQANSSGRGRLPSDQAPGSLTISHQEFSSIGVGVFWSILRDTESFLEVPWQQLLWGICFEIPRLGPHGQAQVWI